jgi:hypothetical protein
MLRTILENDPTLTISDGLKIVDMQIFQAEVKESIRRINQARFSSYKELITAVQLEVARIDPHDTRELVRIILDNIHPEHADMLLPENMILFSGRSTTKNTRPSCLTWILKPKCKENKGNSSYNHKK